ncbi:MAG TPA: hypothetical protein VGM37_09175 [Armatimonadota bacterium]
MAFRWPYIFLLFGSLAVAAYRGNVLRQVTWDLLGLAMAGSIIVVLYELAMGVMTKGIVKAAVMTGLISVVAAVTLALAMKR